MTKKTARNWIITESALILLNIVLFGWYVTEFLTATEIAEMILYGVFAALVFYLAQSAAGRLGERIWDYQNPEDD